jgi:nitrous oxide reductase accessory protein NosL
MNSKFTAKIIQGDTTHYFCDIGDLFSYLKRKGLNDVAAQVKDYTTGEWIDAAQASYVRAEKKFKTPMGWGIAAFKDKNIAGESGRVMDFKATALTFK